MGQKIHPIGFRLSVLRNWSSKWYANSKNFPGMLQEDIKVRDFLKQKLAHAAVGKIIIERPTKNAKITIYSARPGVVIGKKGEDIESLRGQLQKMLGVPVHINIEEIRKPEVDAQLIADSIAQQLQKRIMFRRAMKRAMQNAMRLGAQGIKIASSGRLNGIEIARNEWYREGRVPLHTLRADIDYGFGEAKTTYGVIGIKVWVYKGETVGKSEQPATVPGSAPEEAPQPKKVRKAPAPVAKAGAPAAKTEASADAKPKKAAPRARKKASSEGAAKAGDVTKTEAKAEGSTNETAKPAAKAKTTVRRVTKKTGA